MTKNLLELTPEQALVQIRLETPDIVLTNPTPEALLLHQKAGEAIVALANKQPDEEALPQL